MYRKGHNYRIWIDSHIVAEETSCTITKGVDTEDATNKDTAPGSQTLGAGELETIYKTQTIQVEAEGEGAEKLYTAAKELMNATGGELTYAPTADGNQNRIVDGTATYVWVICTDLTITATNRQSITCSAQFTVVPEPASPPNSTSNSDFSSSSKFFW